MGQARWNKTAERDAIKRVVQGGEIMVVWLDGNGMIEWCPTAQGGCALFAVRPNRLSGEAASGEEIMWACAEVMIRAGLPMLVIQGVTGLGATDRGRQEWGGDDQRTHDAIWAEFHASARKAS